MSHYTIPIFIPELACPNRCVFCNQQKISGSLFQPSIQDVIETIDLRLSTIPSGNAVEVGFFGGNFTGLSKELQESYLSIAQRYVDEGRVAGIRFSTRPDYIDTNILSFLQKFSITAIELGAQSLDSEVLKLSGRGHTAEDVKNASAMILEKGYQLGLQMMIGLPGDTFEKSVSTARQIVSLGAGCTRIYPTLVIKDTELESMYLGGRYAPLTLSEAVAWTKEIVKVFEEGNVKILRMGLHPSEGMLNGDILIAGPFHVAFGEIVQSALWGEALGKEIKSQFELQGENDRFKAFLQQPDREFTGKMGLSEEEKIRKDPTSPIPLLADKMNISVDQFDKLIVEVPVGQVNAATGHYAVNKKMLAKYFKKVVFRESFDLRGREFRLFAS